MTLVIFDGVEYGVFNHLYAASRCGKFLRKLQPITPRLRPDGYLEFGRQLLAHRVVASVWLEKPDGANHVHHINWIKSDNRAENLEWLSAKKHIAEKHHGSGSGHKMSEAGKERLRQLRTGTKTSEETKQKQREASIRLGCKPPARPVGFKCSDFSRQKMRENSPNAIKCVINGVVYSSCAAAAKSLGMKRPTLRKRCLSKNFPEYQLIRG